MADTYNSTNINEWDASTPADTDSIGDVGKAIRQIKNTIITVDNGEYGLTAFLKETLKDFIVETITERFKHFYRVGDIICTQNRINPSGTFGGTWEMLEHGAFLRAEVAPAEETAELTTRVVYTQYKDIQVSGSELSGEGNDGYLLYTKDPKWSTHQNENVAVDYIPVYMWKKIADEENV